MTEAQWLASEDPAAMIDHLTTEYNDPSSLAMWHSKPRRPSLASDRKLRLFTAACCRMIQPRGDDWPYFLLAVGDLEEAADVHPFVMSGLARKYFHPDWDAPTLAEWAAKGVKGAAGALRDIVGNPYKPVTLPYVPDGGRVDGVLTGSGRIARHLAVDQWEFADHCPWLTPQVMDLAAAAYEHRIDGTLDPFRLALLADALEDAGCPAEVSEYGEVECPECEGAGEFYGAYHADDGMEACDRCGGRGVVMGDREEAHPLLAHLRSPGPHFRGCWAVDLVLGKE